jgi:hypothetical protein
VKLWEMVVTLGLGALSIELYDWSGIAAKKIVPLAVRLWTRDADRREIYAEAWLADVEDCPGKLARLCIALRFLGGGAARWTLHQASRPIRRRHPRNASMPPWQRTLWRRLVAFTDRRAAAALIGASGAFFGAGAAVGAGGYRPTLDTVLAIGAVVMVGYISLIAIRAHIYIKKRQRLMVAANRRRSTMRFTFLDEPPPPPREGATVDEQRGLTGRLPPG